MRRKGATLVECLAASVCLVALAGGVGAAFEHVSRVQRSIALRNAALQQNQLQFEAYRFINANNQAATAGNFDFSGSIPELPGATYTQTLIIVRPTGTDYVEMVGTTTVTDGRITETVRIATMMRVNAIAT